MLPLLLAAPHLPGEVKVETLFDRGEVILSVSDTGCGMDDVFIRDTLFQPFQSTKISGLGIGMFQCMSIVEAHGGSIEVESEPGRGTRFRVVLPIAADEKS